MEEVRAFVAIELPDEVKSVLSKLQRGMKSRHTQTVRWVDTTGIHLTLKFLGAIPAAKIEDIIQGIVGAADRTGPIGLTLSKAGAFPNLESPRVIWVGVQGDVEPLLNLHKGIDRSLVPLGFSPEPRGYTPHLTVGRIRDGATNLERKELGIDISIVRMDHNVSFVAKEVCLMKSSLTSKGAVYDQIASIPFSKASD